MAAWRKICFYHNRINNSSAASFTATNSATGCPVTNLYDMSEINKWQALDTSSPQYITLDTGAGGVKTMADYLCIYGHNLGTANAIDIVLQYSEDGSTWTSAFTPFMAMGNDVILKEFTNPGSKRYWRLYFAGVSVIPYITVCIWGMKTELDYVSSGFDPYQQDVQANVNVSYGGALAGVHINYIQRLMNLFFADIKAVSSTTFADGTYLANGSITAGNDESPTVYEKTKHWWDNSSVNNFFVAWEIGNNSKDVFLMRPETGFNNPLKNGGIYRDINISLTGVSV